MWVIQSFPHPFVRPKEGTQWNAFKNYLFFFSSLFSIRYKQKVKICLNKTEQFCLNNPTRDPKPFLTEKDE